MGENRDEFYIVRKGNMVGIYKSLSDCQDQLKSSVHDPSVCVYKGSELRKETMEYLASHGFRNAVYSIHAEDLTENLFGNLSPCSFQHSEASVRSIDKAKNQAEGKRPRDKETANSAAVKIESSNKHVKFNCPSDSNPTDQSDVQCIIEFDGASKGNPGKAGAGAIVRSRDGIVIARVREGLGIATNNVAEYRGLILGLKYAIKRGFKHIQAQGDSKLVCSQVQGIWQTKNQNMADLCKKAKELKNMFATFDLVHVRREFNADADAQANLAVGLCDGEIQEESCIG